MTKLNALKIIGSTVYICGQYKYLGSLNIVFFPYWNFYADVAKLVWKYLNNNTIA